MLAAHNMLGSGPASSRLDCIASRYSGEKDDPVVQSEVREAFKLLSVAEGHLDDEQEPNCEEATKAATDAKAIFSSRAPLFQADALRLIILARKAQGDKAGAEDLAKTSLDEFKAKGDQRGHGIMILALAEARLEATNKDPFANEEAAMAANEAADVFGKLSDRDTRFEALSHIAVAKLQTARRLPKDAIEAANKAVDLCQTSGDLVVLAKASHELGKAHVLNEDVDHVKNGIKFGIQAFKNALAIYQDLGMKTMFGYETIDTARAMLRCLYKPKAITTMVKEVYFMFKNLEKSTAAVTCLELLVQASLKYGDVATAASEAFDAVMYFRKLTGAERAIARSWVLMTEAHIAQGEAEKAVEAISNAVKIAQDLQDKALMLKVLKAKGTAQTANRVFEDASATLAEARELCKELEDPIEEAAVLGLYVEVGLASTDIERAVQAAEDQREIYQRLGRKSEESSALLTAATCLADQTTDLSQISRALTRAKDARETAKQVKDSKAEGAALLLMAKLQRSLESDDDAMEAAAEVLKVLKNAAQAEKAQGAACSELARCYLDRGMFDEALKSADQASSFAKKSEDPMFEAEVLIMVAEVNYGVAIRQEQDTRKGVKCFHLCSAKSWQSAKLAKARCERFKYKELLPKALCAVAEVGVVFDTTLAAQCAEQAQSISSELEDDLGVATAVVLHANILYHKGENSAAKSMAERGLRLAEEAGASDVANDAKDIIQRTQPKAGAAVVQEVAVGDAPAAAAAATGVSIAVAAEPTGMDPAMVTETVMRIASQSIAADEELEMDTPLMDAGLDSLSSVAFRNTLMNELKLQMPAALMFDYPNVRQLTDYIVDKSKGG